MTGADNEIFGLLAEVTAVAPPSPLGDLVVHAATSARPIGQAIASLGGGEHADAAVAFVQTVDEFKSVLAEPAAGRSSSPMAGASPNSSPTLLEVDLYFGRQLGLWEHDIDESLEDDHLAMTEAAIRAAVKADFGTTVARWLDVSSAVCAHVASLDAEQLAKRIKFHMLDTRISTALVVRVFEVWTHIEDLCRTLRRDPPPLDGARLHLMTRTAVRAIPLGMLLGGIDGGTHTARLVLTGSGGGVWNQPLQLGAEAGEPSVTIIADALQFCRLAAQRIAPADLDAEIDGPMDLAITVFRGASVFAA